MKTLVVSHVKLVMSKQVVKPGHVRLMGAGVVQRQCVPKVQITTTIAYKVSRGHVNYTQYSITDSAG